MPILTSDDYPAILAALDTKLTSADVPDSLLDRIIYAPAADQDVIKRFEAAGSALDPEEEVEGDTANANRIKRAAIYFCAARLAPAAIRITSLSVNTRDMSFSRETLDPGARAAELRALAEAELADILEPDEETPNRPTMFRLAPGYRGR